nr:polyribonucleotide nucleotidyltransferase 1, mitochondrial-like [Pocillopora verrucosa]
MASLARFRANLRLEKEHFLAWWSSLKRLRLLQRCKHTECAVEVEVGGQKMSFATGKMARLADGAVVAEHGGNSTLVAVVGDKKSKPTGDKSLHLKVDYKEKAAAGGQIPKTFFRKDVILSERETIVSRRIDRSLRSLFPNGYHDSTQITGILWAATGLHDPDIAAMNGASAAVSVSDIPWSGPIGAVRVGEVDGKFVINPTWSELSISKLNLVVACSKTKVVMIEAFAQEVSSERFCEAVRFGFKKCQTIIEALLELQRQAGKKKDMSRVGRDTPPEEIKGAIVRFNLNKEFDKIFSNFAYSKMERDKEMFKVRDDHLLHFQGRFPNVAAHEIENAIFEETKSVFRNNVLYSSQRCDGRAFDALRPITCEVDLFKSLHGSALFQRGETQVFCTATLGSLRSAKQPDAAVVGVGDVKERPFMLHYEFPPFCVNGIGLIGGSSRREIGHGNLAEMALEPVVPKDFPFTIRLTSQVLESNGSSSLASVCAGSLAMMDAGIPITRPVAGVACGLITSSDAEDPDKPDIENYCLLTDILGIEDFMGDMDFKLAGSREGITALQADFKVPGLPLHIVEEAVKKATADRMKVLDLIEECQSGPRKIPKDNLPVQGNVVLSRLQVRKLFSAGGLTIKNLQEETGSIITRVEDDEFHVFAYDAKAFQEVLDKMKEITAGADTEKHWTESLEVGATYKATITEFREYGIMVELLPDTPSVLLHTSEISHHKSHQTTNEFTLGQIVDVMYLGKDPFSGKVRLSRKALLPKPHNTMNHEDFVEKFLSPSKK